MKIILNGTPRDIPEASDLRSFVEKHKRTSAPVIAELNGEIIKAPLWETTRLNDGDALELISFVGGGSTGRIATILR